MSDASPSASSEGDAISTIRNLGPASEAAFARAGIYTADALREIGADAAYRRLLESGSRPHFISYYVLVMGLQGRPWNDCQGEEKKALRQRFDLICAAVKQSDQGKARVIDQAISQFGVVAKG